MNNRQMHRVRDLAIRLYKDGNYGSYDPELQTMLCTILAFQQVAMQEYGIVIPFKLEERKPYQPIDEE
jgi:hypothetical protein